MPEPRYIDVFIEPNPNTPEGCGQRFKSESPPRLVSLVRYDDGLCQVSGWSSAAGGSPCPALASVVEDSGSGTAVLIHGGDWGLRITPRAGGESYGEPYLLLAPEAVLS